MIINNLPDASATLKGFNRSVPVNPAAARSRNPAASESYHHGKPGIGERKSLYSNQLVLLLAGHPGVAFGHEHVDFRPHTEVGEIDSGFN